MKRVIKILLVIILIFVSILFWYWADSHDYFQSDYKDLTAQEAQTFKWQDNDTDEKLKERYIKHFADSDLGFPRQKVWKVKLFRNIPMVSIFTSRTLRQDQISNFLKFCNDSANFSWGETTWSTSESEYYFRLYSEDDKVVGKIYVCLDKCSMTCSRPLSPSMKFGGLSTVGLNYIETIINDKTKWK